MAQMTKLAYQKALRGAELTPTEYMVLVTLSTYADGQMRNAYPGWARLAEDTHLDKRTIKKAAASLQKKGYLILAVPGGNQHRKGLANAYHLTLPEGRGASSVPLVDERGTPSDPLEGGEGVHPVHPRGTSGAHEGVHPVTPHQVLTSNPSSAAASATKTPRQLLTDHGLQDQDHDDFLQHIGAKSDGLVLYLHKQGQLATRVDEFQKRQRKKTTWSSWDLPAVDSPQWHLKNTPCNVCGALEARHTTDCSPKDRTCPTCWEPVGSHAQGCELKEYLDARFLDANPWMNR